MSSLLTTHCQQNVGSCESSSWTLIFRNSGTLCQSSEITVSKPKCQAVKVQELLTLSLLFPRKRAKTTGFCGEHLIPTQDSQKTNKSSEPGRAPAFPTSYALLVLLVLLPPLVLLFPLLLLVQLCPYCPASSPSLPAPTGLLNCARAAITTQTQYDDCLFFFGFSKI